MTRTRASASLALATALAGSALSMTLAAPMAHATPLDDIASVVKRDRPATCAPLVYNGVLEGAAQKYARSENPVDGQPAGNNGRTLAFLGSGDPQAAATTSAYQRGAGGLISNCDFTEFGVGFIRYEDGQPLGAGNRRGDDLTIDVVTIVFGAPPAPPVAPVAPQPPSAKPNKPEGPVISSTTIACPKGSTKTSVLEGEVCPPPSANSVTMDIALDNLGAGTVTVKSSANLAGKCTYNAKPVLLFLLPSFDTAFDLAPNGSFSFDTPAKGVARYAAVLSCKGDYNGSSIEYGHVEKTV